MPSALGFLQRAVPWSSLPGSHAIVAGFVAALVAIGTSFAPAQAAPRGTACVNPQQSLGVARVVEVDTASGPHFGHQQYKDIELLAPGEIVLTFDDGPLRHHTQPIIDALEAQCTKATFFMVGSQAIADPDMVRQIMRKGHTVGTHTWSHANLRKSTPLKARQEIELGFSAVTAAAGQPIAPFFRFPYLADTKAMNGYTQTRGLGVFSIEIDSEDWKTKNAVSVHREVLTRLAEAGKGIILFHDIQPATAQALPGLLEALREKGYRVVHLKAKTPATTIPEFDTLARDAKGRNQIATTADPLTKRSVTWGAAPPTVMARAPSGSTQPAAQPAFQATGQPWAQGQPAPPARSAAVVRPNTGQPYGQPTPYGQPGPYGQAAGANGLAPAQPLPPLPVPNQFNLPPPGDPNQQLAKVARQRTPPVEDWRDKVFSR